MDDADISYQFYVALDALEETFDFLDDAYPEHHEETHWFRLEMETVADDLLNRAAQMGWRVGYEKSRFRAFRMLFDEFTHRAVADSHIG